MHKTRLLIYLQIFFWHALQPSTALPSDFSNVIPAREKQGSEIQWVECSALPLQQHTRPDLKRPHALQAKCQESLPERSLNCVFMAYCHLIIKLRMFLLYLKIFFLFCCQISATLLVIMQTLGFGFFTVYQTIAWPFFWWNTIWFLFLSKKKKKNCGFNLFCSLTFLFLNIAKGKWHFWVTAY